MRLLLLGRGGQLGHELQRVLAPLGDVVAPGRGDADLERPEAIARMIRERRPDVVVNAAAYTAVDRAEQEPDRARVANADAPGSMAKEAALAGARLVHYSTDYVFDGTATQAYREGDPTGPLNAYGATKLAGEEAIRGSGVQHLILRTSWVYSNRRTNFLSTMLRLAAEQPQLRVVDDQIGAPTWAAHIAAATALVLARWRDQSGTYHLSAAGHTSWCGFAREILAQAGLPPKVVPITTDALPRPARRPAWSVLDNTRLHDTFGIALPDWREGLERCLAERRGE